MERSDDLIKDLVEIARVEREFLLSGNLIGLADIEPLKQDLVKLAATRLDRRSMSLVGESFAKNQPLFAAAISGLKSAKSKIDAIKDSSGDLRTYGPNGCFQSIGSIAAKLGSKA